MAARPGLTLPITKDLCNESPGLQDHSILRVCWEECGGSQLPPYQAKRQRGKMAFTRLDLWRKPSITRKQSKVAKIETSEQDLLLLLRCTLRLFANAIIRQPNITVKAPDAFRADVQPIMQEARLMAEIRSSVHTKLFAVQFDSYGCMHFTWSIGV